MTDKRQFGGGKMRQFGDRPGGGVPGDSQHCAKCESMLADAIDGTLSAEDQAAFDRHATICEPCGQMVADARRGAAWLELLRDPAPEPPAELLERILVQTSWPLIHGEADGIVPAAIASLSLTTGSGNVVAFPRQTFAGVRLSGLRQIVMQPRLAMTAAMAFFSIALTMNITGFHPAAVRLADLEPSSLRRDFFAANAHVVQYYEGLRVVYELESRVRDLQSAQDADSPAGSEVAPAGDAVPAQPAAKPEPIPNAVPATKQPRGTQHDHGKAFANPRTSRREDLMETRRLVVAETLRPVDPGDGQHTRVERRQV